jgi:hypothetical protein
MEYSIENLFFDIQGKWTLKGGMIERSDGIEVEVDMPVEINGYKIDYYWNGKWGNDILDIAWFEPVKTYRISIPKIGFNLCYLYEMKKQVSFTLILFKPNPWLDPPNPIRYNSTDLMKSTCDSISVLNFVAGH